MDAVDKIKKGAPVHLRQRLPEIIATAALIGATAFPLIWTALAMRAPRLLPVLASVSISPAITVGPSASSSSRYASKPASDDGYAENGCVLERRLEHRRPWEGDVANDLKIRLESLREAEATRLQRLLALKRMGASL